MFNRHNEMNRVVEEIPGGVRTTTESNAPELVAQLQAHVSSMYSDVGQGAEVMCMSGTLPTLGDITLERLRRIATERRSGRDLGQSG